MKRLIGDCGTRSSVKRCRKSGSTNGEDGISNLPESIISHILSCLPTKDAVRTCVLSKDWEFKWTSIYHIQIDNSPIRRCALPKDGEFKWNPNYNEASFVNYVERIILLTHDIRSFSLRCWEGCDSSRVLPWITAVLRRNVESFELSYLTTEGFLLPRSLLNSTSLTSLNLYFPESPCSLKVPSENCFPNLVELYFCGVEIRNELSNSDTLKFTFPVLETMGFGECKWVNVKHVEINAPALTKFAYDTPDDTQVDDYSIYIVGSKLTDFETSGDLPENLFFTGSSVARAALKNKEGTLDFHLLEIGSRVRKWLNGFQSLEDLKLSGWIAKAIARSEQGLAIPRYNKLRRLSLVGCTDVEVLLELLHAAPCLKSLVFDMYWQPTPQDYEAVRSLPYCLLNQLEEVEFLDYCFSPLMYDFCLEKFLLKNGLRLKAFHLRCGNKKDEMLEILKLLVTFPKGSDCLTFVIH